MDLSSKAVFGIDGVKVSLENEAKRLKELSEELANIHISLSKANQKEVLDKLESLKSSISMCHTMMIYYHQVLDEFYKDYNTEKGVSLASHEDETVELDFENLTLKEMKQGLKVV